jgi:hypothetical protein
MDCCNHFIIVFDCLLCKKQCCIVLFRLYRNKTDFVCCCHIQIGCAVVIVKSAQKREENTRLRLEKLAEEEEYSENICQNWALLLELIDVCFCEM